MGIVPTRPETGYGYIKVGEAVGEEADIAFSTFAMSRNLT